MFRQEEHPTPTRTPRSFLYAPGDRPDLVVKALASAAHAVIIDLEDAVPPTGKAGARATLTTLLDDLDPADAATRPLIHVRCNRTDTGWEREDLLAAVHPAVDVLRLAKAEDPAAVAAVAAEIEALEIERGLMVGSIGIDLLIESATGVLLAPGLAASPRVRRLCLGGADLSFDLGVQVDRAACDPLALARQTLVLASRAAGLPGPVDTVSTDFQDDDALSRRAQQARALGFSGSSAIHPRQLPLIHAAFLPDAAEVAWATRVVEAWRSAEARGEGVLVIDRAFVDAPVAARAAQVLIDAASDADAPGEA